MKFATFLASYYRSILGIPTLIPIPLLVEKEQYTNLEISSFESSAYANVLRNCTKNTDFIIGKELDCDVLKRGGWLDLFGKNNLVNLYVKSELLLFSVQLCHEMPT
uniref:Uncharacterized protein n=1 Tax=Solanum lycopersicum TaxID=4081 RepID=A0A3Q7HBT1_SOLLC